MNFLQIKNYRSFKNLSFLSGDLNFFVGENNTGKTSLMNLINSISNSKRLNFESTWLENINMKDIIGNDGEFIDIFIGFYQEGTLKDEKDTTLPLFEKIKLYTIENYDKPLIHELVTLTPNYNLVKFVIDYKLENNKIMVNKIIFHEIENNFIISEYRYKESEDLIEHLNNQFKDKKPLNSFEIEIEDYNSLYNSLDKLDKNTDTDTNRFKYEYNIFMTLTKMNINNHPNERLFVSNIYKLYLIQSNFVNKDKEFTFFNIYERKSWRFFDKFNNFKYIKPLRPLFKEYYTEDEFKNNNNELIDSLLIMNNNKKISKLVNTFLSEISEIVEIKIKPVKVEYLNKNIYIPLYKVKNSDKEYKLKYSGTGISQILPILTRIFTMNNHNHNHNAINSICIEQPEVHLHPWAQKKLGALLFNSLISETKKNSIEKEIYSENIFIETHSNSIIDSLRIEIFKKNSRAHEKIKIFFFNKEKSETKVDKFWIDKNGRFSGEYSKYLDFFENEAFELLGI